MLLPWFLWRGVPELVGYSLLTLPAAIAQRLKDAPDEAMAERHA